MATPVHLGQFTPADTYISDEVARGLPSSNLRENLEKARMSATKGK